MNAVKKRSLSPDVLKRLRAYLARKAFAPQGRLPPERELATIIGCSRETLRTALDKLEREGLIWRHVGQGTFMGPRPASEPIRPPVLFEMASPVDVLDARLLLEPAIAGAAASKISANDVKLLRRWAITSGEARTWQAYEQADNAFHAAIARVTGNPLLIAFLDVLSSVRGRARWQRHHDRAFRWARKQEYAVQQGRMHITIVDAIAKRDTELASRAMRDHLNAIKAIMLEQQE